MPPEKMESGDLGRQNFGRSLHYVLLFSEVRNHQYSAGVHTLMSYSEKRKHVALTSSRKKRFK